MDSLHQRRNAMDILIAYDFIIVNRDPDIDLQFVSRGTRSTGFYRIKSGNGIKGKYSKTHFSSRVVSLLQKYNIKLHAFASSDQLRLYLSSINLTGPKLQNSNYYSELS
uniref:Homing endonuclease LAGLIDADG domain-containing protein n=1 Tax=Panagrolaimus sp. ES5 TaxID=591445 RepID=A0AC34G3C7_9BILA